MELFQGNESENIFRQGRLASTLVPTFRPGTSALRFRCSAQQRPSRHASQSSGEPLSRWKRFFARTAQRAVRCPRTVSGALRGRAQTEPAHHRSEASEFGFSQNCTTFGSLQSQTGCSPHLVMVGHGVSKLAKAFGRLVALRDAIKKSRLDGSGLVLRLGRHGVDLRGGLVEVAGADVRQHHLRADGGAGGVHGRAGAGQPDFWRLGGPPCDIR